MAMKYKLLYSFGRNDAATRKHFMKWEYRVVWEYPRGTLQESEPLPSRAEARRYKKCLWSKLNPRIERRLVEARWRPYNDTFTYSAKGNGNGR